MKNLLYIAQFHETCGYSHASHGYLKSLHSLVSSRDDINLKILSVSLDPKKINLNFHKNKTNPDLINLFDQYHFTSQKELENFTSQDYHCLWHMTSILPEILKKPNVCNLYKELKANIGELILGSISNSHILAWETDEVPQEYKACIEKYSPSVVFAPSKWNVDTFSKFTDSAFLPHLIEYPNGQSQKIKFPFDPKDNFCIFSLSEWTNRKNFECLIRSFIMEFHDIEDAYLIIKTNLPVGVSKQQFLENFDYIKKTTRTYSKSNVQNIVVIIDYLSDEKINYLYEISDLYAITSFGEGFSLPTARAAIGMTPILCPDKGGHVDYLSMEGDYFIDGQWDTVLDAPPYDNDGNWYIPTMKSTRKKLKLAYSDWKDNPDRLKKNATLNYSKASSDIFNRGSIAKTIINQVDKSFEEFSSNIESKVSALKRVIQNLPLEQKVEKLKDFFKDEDCYILSCGPSLAEYNKDKLSSYLKDKLVLSVKQAYEVFSGITDFHFFNCSNLPERSAVFSPHYYYDNSVISIGSSNYDQYMRWPTFQISDLFFKVPIRTEINNEFLVRTGKIDEYLLKNRIERPCGPGIMYETVLYTAIHLGVKSITCIGWDLTRQKVNEDNYKHFFGSTKGLINRGDILDWEIEETRKFSKDFYYWCKNNKIQLKIASSQSSLYEGIPRVKLEL